MQPLVLAGLGLDPQLARMLSRPLAWLVVSGIVWFLLRSRIVPTALKLIVTTLIFIAGIGWADKVGFFQAVTGHNPDDADKLLVALATSFVVWLAFLREDRTLPPERTFDEQLPVRVLTRGRR